MRPGLQYSFAQIPAANIERSVFDRTFTYKTTMDEGYLVPFLVDDVLPGDTYNVKAQFFARLTCPLKYPVIDNMYLDTHYFAVPYRLVWDNFKKFMGEQVDPGDSTDYLLPQIPVSNDLTTMAANLEGRLADYFGIPPVDGSTIHVDVCAIPFRAYNLIWNEWFRDENLQDSVVVDRDDGPDTFTDYKLLKRGKRHDYFTSSLPWPQKGDAVSVPLGTSAPVYGDGYNMSIAAASSSLVRGLERVCV